MTVSLVAVACRNFGRAFCARSECRCRPGMFRVCSAARAAASAAAARASSDEDDVTWVDVMERIAWRRNENIDAVLPAIDHSRDLLRIDKRHTVGVQHHDRQDVKVHCRCVAVTNSGES